MNNQPKKSAGRQAAGCTARMGAPSPDEALKLDNQLCFPLYACSKEIVRRYTPFLNELGITYTQYIALMALWARDGVTVGELGARLYLDSGTLTPLLKKMEAGGLVARQRDAADERRVIVTLTKQGRDLKKKAQSVPSRIAGCVKLDPEDAIQLHGLLHKVLDGFAEGEANGQE